MSKKIKRLLRRRKYGYEHVPRQLSIALTNRCNARCAYCGISEKSLNKDMTFESFKKIIDAMPFIDEVQPQIVGEPMLHGMLTKVVKYCKSLGKKVVIYTNASIFHSSVAAELFEAGLDRLIFSIDDDHKEGFEKHRVGLVWEKVMENVYNYRQVRDAIKAKTRLSVRICKTPENAGRIKDIKKFWSSLVDDVAVAPVINVFAGKSKDIIRLKRGYECPLLEDSISVDANGQLLLCCKDWYGELEPPLGNLLQYDRLTQLKVLELYNSSMMDHFRRCLKEGIYIPKLCGTCLNPYETDWW